jgi:hypothetical protein
MEQLFIYSLISVVSFVKTLPANNPAYMDLVKVVVGSISWIGGLLGYLYYREKNLKAAAVNK